jgi:phosphoglycolate phosphatase
VSGLRLAVFDCDGTLIDSQTAIIGGMQAAFVAEGLEPPAADAVRRVVGLPLEECVRCVAPPLDPAQLLRLVEGYKHHVFALRSAPDHDEPLYPGAHEALSELERAGWLLGIATGKGRRGLRNTLDRLGWHGRFVTLQTGDDAPGKPDPTMLRQAMDEAGVDARSTVMIGDTSYDIAMARSAGVFAIGVAWGYHPQRELRDAGAAAIVTQFDQIPPLLVHRGRS